MKEMGETRISWLRRMLNQQSAGARKFFWSFALGAFIEEAKNDPKKTYTVLEVIEIISIIAESMKEDESC